MYCIMAQRLQWTAIYQNVRWTLDSAEACYVDVTTGDIHPILEAGTDESYRYVLDAKDGAVLQYSSGKHGFVTQADLIVNFDSNQMKKAIF